MLFAWSYCPTSCTGGRILMPPSFLAMGKRPEHGCPQPQQG